MARALDETRRRRARQAEYNREHGIEPKTILKEIHSPLVRLSELDLYDPAPRRLSEVAEDSAIPLAERIATLEKQMREHARRLEFEEAAQLRDQIKQLKDLRIYA
jgi:excinuclease ABC subunit B